AGVLAGGFFTVKLSGTGMVAIGVQGDPLALPVTAGSPVFTDPHATLAWSAGLSTELKTDLSWRSLVRRGGDEPVQFQFEGEGHVTVVPISNNYCCCRYIGLMLERPRPGARAAGVYQCTDRAALPGDGVRVLRR